MFNQLMVGQKKMAEDIACIKSFQESVLSRFGKLESRVTVLESSIPVLEDGGLQEHLRSQIDNLSGIVTELISKNDDLENRSRRNNIIFHGLAEQSKETSADLLANISRLITATLKIECPQIERCHRIGRVREGHPRPVILKLLNFNSKFSVLKMRSD